MVTKFSSPVSAYGMRQFNRAIPVDAKTLSYKRDSIHDRLLQIGLALPVGRRVVPCDAIQVKLKYFAGPPLTSGPSET